MTDPFDLSSEATAHLTEADRLMLLRLLSSAALTDEQAAEAVTIQREHGSPLLDVLLARQFISARDYAAHLAELTETGYAGAAMDAPELASDPELVHRFDPAELMRFLFCPVSAAGDMVVVLAVEPSEPKIREIVERVVPGCEVVALAATEPDIRKRVDAMFRQSLLDKAVNGLRNAVPAHSASTVMTTPQIVVLIGLIAIAIASLVLAFWTTLKVTILVVSALYVLAALYKLTIGLASSTRRVQASRASDSIPAADLPIYSILVPVYKEPQVIPTLLAALARLDYPSEKLDVLILMEEDDTETIAQAKAANAPSFFRFIYVPKSKPQTKPKACNYGLSFCRGEFVTIYDAEDVPEPNQLRRAVQAFRDGPANLVCVQAALNYFNPRENYLTRMFTLEYSYWFDYMLPGLDRLGLPIPLGGTSNHFPLARLRELGAWDPFNVTEDADLGIRASARDYTVGVIDSTTFEEANRAYGNWIRQRSRWIKGYMQTWLVHNRRPLALLRRIGLKRWLSYQFFIGGTCFTFLANPLLLALCLAAYLMPPEWTAPLFDQTVARVTLLSLALGNIIAIAQSIIAVGRRRLWDLIPFALTNPLYWCMHSYAAYVALWQLFTKPFYWEKTTHGLTSVDVHQWLDSTSSSALPLRAS